MRHALVRGALLVLGGTLAGCTLDVVLAEQDSGGLPPPDAGFPFDAADDADASPPDDATPFPPDDAAPLAD